LESPVKEIEVRARNRDVGDKPEDDQHPEGEKELPSKVRLAERVRNSRH
jgi:hypothetical protein